MTTIYEHLTEDCAGDCCIEKQSGNANANTEHNSKGKQFKSNIVDYASNHFRCSWCNLSWTVKSKLGYKDEISQP